MGIRKYGYDGIVIECGYPAFFEKFLIKLAQLLHKEGRELVLVLPSIINDEHKQFMNAKIFEAMAHYIDLFSLMTYDYSSHDP